MTVKNSGKMVITPRSYKNFLLRFMKKAHKFDSMLGSTKEMLNAHLILQNPIDRIVIDDFRRPNPAFAIAEFVQLMAGGNDLEFIKQFNSSYDKYSDDGRTIAGAYGARNSIIDGTQVETIVKELTDNPNSRRAIFSIYQAFDTGAKTSNKPCTLSLQFLIRENKLYCITNMRSNDVIWGLTYDMFVFTMIQEWVCRSLQANGVSVELGEYYHNAGSLHIYDYHYAMPSNMDGRTWNLLMNDMPVEFTKTGDMARLHRALKNVRYREAFIDIFSDLETQYARDLAAVCRLFVIRKDGTEEIDNFFRGLEDSTLRRWIRPWIYG